MVYNVCLYLYSNISHNSMEYMSNGPISVDKYKLAKARSIIYDIPWRPKEDVLLVSGEIEKLFEVKKWQKQ